MKACSTLIILLFQCAIIAQPNLDWKKNYGGSGDDVADQILKTLNGYFISGSTTSKDGDFIDNPESLSYFIMKVDLLGDLEWKVYYSNKIIATAKDYKEDIVFIKAIDEDAFHIEKLNKQGKSIFVDTIISVERPILPRDLAEIEKGKFRIIGDLAEEHPRDGVFNCNYNAIDNSYEMDYFPRYWTGAINNYLPQYSGIIEFQDTAIQIGYTEFQRTFERFNFPEELTDCDLNTDTKLVACSDNSYMLYCKRVTSDSVYIYQTPSSQLYGKPLAGNKNSSWFYSQIGNNISINAFTLEGDSLYLNQLSSSGMDLAKDATIAYDESLVLLLQSDGGDGDFPINQDGQDFWIFKYNNFLDRSIQISLQDTLVLCSNDSLLICPTIDGCYNCTYEWADGSSQLEHWVTVDSSTNYELNISNNSGFDTTLQVFIKILSLPMISYQIESDSDCPGTFQNILFDTNSCFDCNLIINSNLLDTNIIQVFPLKDENLIVEISNEHCTNELNIPLNVYDFEVQIITSYCADSSNQIEIVPIGGNGEIGILWEDGNNNFIRNDLVQGQHSFIISDSLCTIGDSTLLSINYRINDNYAQPGFYLKDTGGNTYQTKITAYANDELQTVYDAFLLKFNSSGDLIKSSFIHQFYYYDYSTIRWLNGNILFEERDGIYRTYNTDLELVTDEIEVLPFHKSVIKKIMGDTIWDLEFSNFPWHTIHSPDSTKVLICGSEFLYILNESTGEVMNQANIGGGGNDKFSHALYFEDRIVVLMYTNSSDGNLEGINSTDSSRLWLFETDLNLENPRSYKLFIPFDQSTFYSSYSKLHQFKDGGILSDLGQSIRFNAEGETLWHVQSGYNYFNGDTIFFQDGSIIIDEFEYSGIRPDSLNIEQDSTITTTSIPGSNILWSTGDTTSTITVSDPGTYTVQIESPDGCVTLDTIIVFARSVANYDIALENHTIQVYPNPNNGEFVVESETKIQSIRIFNAMGEAIQEVQFPNGVKKHRINLNTDFAGLYIVQCQINNSWHNKKIITSQ